MNVPLYDAQWKSELHFRVKKLNPKMTIGFLHDVRNSFTVSYGRFDITGNVIDTGHGFCSYCIAWGNSYVNPQIAVHYIVNTLEHLHKELARKTKRIEKEALKQKNRRNAV